MSDFNPAVLERAMQARHLDLSEIGERIGAEYADLSAVMAGEEEPSQRLLNALAKELNTPVFAFFMKEVPYFDELIPDFRSQGAIVEAKTKETLEVIQIARRLQEVASGDIIEWIPINGINIENIDSKESAQKIRKLLGLTNEIQRSFKDAREFYYYCRRKIEELGVFILQESFPSTDGSGFALSDRDVKLIVVNTKDQTPARRLFTLMHEFAHIIIGQTGISDPFSLNNRIERKCNKFASLVLLPEDLVKDIFKYLRLDDNPTVEEIATAARLLRVSQQATVIRFEELKLVRAGRAASWLRTVIANGNPDWSKGGGGGGRTEEEKIKLAKYGFSFAKFIDSALKSGKFKPIDIYRFSGLKPKWQNSYIALAVNAGDADVE